LSRKRYKIGPRLLWIANGLVCDLSLLVLFPVSSFIHLQAQLFYVATRTLAPPCINANTMPIPLIFIKTAVKLHIIFINLCRQCSTKKVFYMCIFGSDFYVSYFCIVLVVSLRVVALVSCNMSRIICSYKTKS